MVVGGLRRSQNGGKIQSVGMLRQRVAQPRMQFGNPMNNRGDLRSVEADHGVDQFTAQCRR